MLANNHDIMPINDPLVDVAPYRLSGNVYCSLLNHEPLLTALGDAVHQAPYKAPPKEPVLAVRPRNTLVGDGDPVSVPAAYPRLATGASLAIVIGHSACNISPADAMDHIAGYTVANDISVPLESHYRPAVRFKARDGFCPLSRQVVGAGQINDPDNLTVKVLIDGVEKLRCNTGGRIRSVARLVADVSGFITLHPGDVLLLGPDAAQPEVSAGQRVTVEIEQVGSLSNPFVAEEICT